jgi:DNA-binding NtrC family response regulator
METEELERSALASAAARGGEAMLVIIHSPDAALTQTRHSLAQEVTLVRANSGLPGLALADARISREQARLRWRSDGKGCEVSDLDSRNGTFIEGRRVTSAAAPIGSIVRVGDTLIEIALEPPAIVPYPALVGRSGALVHLFGAIGRFARSDGNVLVEGETGTGKELVAAAIHELGGRSGKLVAVNCASIPPTLAESYLFGHRKGAFTGASTDSPGVFEQAQDGTLFLDEIGELRQDLQAKLLRVLETREFSPLGSTQSQTTTARFVAATNANLRMHVAAGTFRADLFARLAELELATPPLRERRSDIPLLMQHFFAKAAPGVRFELSANALEALLLHPWRLNVRELKAVCTRLALAHPHGGPLRSADLAGVHVPEARTEERGRTDNSSSVPDRAELSERLRAHGGNVLKLAAHYGKDRKQIYRWLELHGLHPRDFRD